MLNIVQGEDRIVTVRLENEDQDAIDLTPYDEISAVFKKADNTQLTKTLTLGGITIPGSAPQNGKIAITLTDTETAALKVGQIDFEVVLDDGTERQIVQFSKQIEIKKRLV